MKEEKVVEVIDVEDSGRSVGNTGVNLEAARQGNQAPLMKEWLMRPFEGSDFEATPDDIAAAGLARLMAMAYDDILLGLGISIITLAFIGYSKDVLPQSILNLLHSVPINQLVDLTAGYVNFYLEAYRQLAPAIGALGMMIPVLRVVKALSNMVSVKSSSKA